MLVSRLEKPASRTRPHASMNTRKRSRVACLHVYSRACSPTTHQVHGQNLLFCAVKQLLSCHHRTAPTYDELSSASEDELGDCSDDDAEVAESEDTGRGRERAVALGEGGEEEEEEREKKFREVTDCDVGAAEQDRSIIEKRSIDADNSRRAGGDGGTQSGGNESEYSSSSAQTQGVLVSERVEEGIEWQEHNDPRLPAGAESILGNTVASVLRRKSAGDISYRFPAPPPCPPLWAQSSLFVCDVCTDA